jgi:hypothetical protein
MDKKESILFHIVTSLVGQLRRLLDLRGFRLSERGLAVQVTTQCVIGYLSARGGAPKTSLQDEGGGQLQHTLVVEQISSPTKTRL